MSNEQKKCSELVEAALESRMEDINEILYTDKFYEYGLDFGFVELGTSSDQTEPYYRYQISWGGPSEEFRIFHDRVEFWFLDWFDGACIDVSDRADVDAMIQTFKDCDMIDNDKLQPIYCVECGNEYVPEYGEMCADCQEEYDNENREYDVEIYFINISRENLIDRLTDILDDLKREKGNLSEEIDDSDCDIQEA